MFDTEGITALTDYALAAVSLGFAIAVGRGIGPHNRLSAWFWCAAFFAAVVAGAAGGAFHSLNALGQEPLRRLLWTMVIVSMSASGAFMTAGVHAAHVQRADGTVAWLAGGIAATLLGAIVQRFHLFKDGLLDHNGTYHVLQILGLYFFYRCARTLRDRPGVLPEAARI